MYLAGYVVMDTLSTTDTHGNGTHQKGTVASQFEWPKPHGLPCLGCDVGGLSQAPSKTQINHRTQEALQVIWDSLPQEPIDKAVKSSHYDW